MLTFHDQCAYEILKSLRTLCAISFCLYIAKSFKRPNTCLGSRLVGLFFSKTPIAMIMNLVTGKIVDFNY